MVQTLAAPIDLADFLALPETQPASEYIDGQILQKPMPKGKHSRIQSKLTAFINAVTEPLKTASAFTELRCTFDGRSIVPDISVFAWERIPRDEAGEVADRFLLAPDWAIEILSPDQSHAQLFKKLRHCFQHGTTAGWIIDPTDKGIMIYRPGQEALFFDLEDGDRPLPLPDFATELTLTPELLFSWLAI
jgi:Uma2 family endonuclease